VNIGWDTHKPVVSGVVFFRVCSSSHSRES
jgi:hypothetical protein